MSKVLIGLQFKGKNVESVGIYDLSKDKLEMITTKRAKELYTGEELVVENATFNFFINSVNTSIGEQEQYPVIFETKNGKTIEDGVIIYDINKTSDNCYKTLLVSTSEVQQVELNDEQLKDLFNSKKYKCNFTVENGLLKITYKEDGQQKELTEDLANEDLFNMFNSWYKIKDGKMEKVKDCSVSTFEVSQGEKIIDGFTNSDIIEEVDLSGATYIAPKAFYNCKNLKKVILSESLEKIGSQAFAKCPNLKELSIPANCSYVGVKIFDNGTVYLQNDLSKYKDIVTPFGAKTEIVLNKKNSQTANELKVAYNSDDKYLYCYNIDLTGLRKDLYIVEKIKISDIDFMDADNYINYKDGEVLKGNQGEDFIVCGKIGKEYLIITNLDDNFEMSQAPFEELKESGGNPTNGTYSKTDIIPLNPNWGWFNIKTSNSNIKNSKVGAQLTEITDTGDILSFEQKMIMADYINKKFESKYGKIILGQAKANKKSQEEKDKFPGYEWIYGGQYPGGIKCDNPGKLNKDTGKIEYKDASGNYYCYFGHNTYNHILAKGYKNGKLMKTFTFGIKCASDFLNIDIAALNKIKEFQGILTQAINQVTDVIKNKSYKNYLIENKRFYEVAQVLKTNNKFDLFGPYGDIARRCIEASIIIPEVVMTDIKDYIEKEEISYDIYTLCIKNRKNLDIIYNYPTLKDLSEDKYISNVKDKLNQYLETDIFYSKANESYLNFKSLSEVNNRVNKLKVDQEEYNKIEKLRQEFDKMNLGRGKSVLEESFYINADECKIEDFSKCRKEDDSKKVELCSFEKQATEDLIEFFNSDNIDRNTKRPTDGSPLYESKYIREAKILRDLLDITNIPDNKVRIISWAGYSSSKSLNRNDFIAVAYKNTLWGYGNGNQAKPILFYKDDKLNLTGEFGLFWSMNTYRRSLYTTFFTNRINDTRAYVELDFDTSLLTNGTRMKLLDGKVNITSNETQAYKDLIHGKDIDNMYLRKSYVPGLKESFNKFSEMIHLDKDKNYLLIAKLGNTKDDKGNIGTAFDYFIHKEDNVVNFYYGCADSSVCYIPYKKLSEMNLIGTIKDNKVIKNPTINIDFQSKGTKYVIYYDGKIKDTDIEKLNNELIERKLFDDKSYKAVFIDKTNKDYYSGGENGNELYKNKEGVIKYINAYSYKHNWEEVFSVYNFNWDPSIVYNNSDREEIEEEDLVEDDFDKTLENVNNRISKENQEKADREARIKKAEDEYAEIESHFEELKNHKDLWDELKLDKHKLGQFDSYRKRSFEYILETVEKSYAKLQKHLGKTTSQNVNNSSNSDEKYDIIFVNALKDNIADLDKWIGDSNYKGAYEQLSKKIINGEPLIGKQYRIVNHIKADLGKYLNCKFK